MDGWPGTTGPGRVQGTSAGTAKVPYVCSGVGWQSLSKALQPLLVGGVAVYKINCSCSSYCVWYSRPCCSVLGYGEAFVRCTMQPRTVQVLWPSAALHEHLIDRVQTVYRPCELRLLLRPLATCNVTGWGSRRAALPPISLVLGTRERVKVRLSDYGRETGLHAKEPGG